MKFTRFNKVLIAFFVCAFLFFAGYRIAKNSVGNIASQTKVFYSLDKRENDQEVIKVIDDANTYVYFAIYTFTKTDIADALVRAKARGLVVEGITDTIQSASAYQKPILAKLAAAGIPMETQKHTDGIMHIKAVVTDNAYALGSYNWTDSATVANDEILEVGTNDILRKEYLDIIKKVISVNAGTTSASVAGQPPVSINYLDASNYIGQNATVSGAPVKIYSSTSGTVFFDYCINYKSCPFSVVIFADDAKKFANILSYQNTNISVTGLLKSYNGHAEIAVTDPSQIK